MLGWAVTFLIIALIAGLPREITIGTDIGIEIIIAGLWFSTAIAMITKSGRSIIIRAS
jgi:hypothetical protein